MCEYKGDLIDSNEAKERDERYESEGKGCYMFYFVHNGKSLCVDATDERHGTGRLINHCREPNNNLFTKKIIVDGVPHICLFSCRVIKKGEELTHDYGDRRNSVIEKNPWL